MNREFWSYSDGSLVELLLNGTGWSREASSELSARGWKIIPGADREVCPNPVVATRSVSDGGTARIRRDGMVDAVDGQVYSLSPGFPTYGDLAAWVRREHRRNNP